MNQVNITPDQVARAAASGIKLLSDDERVSVPPSVAMSGDLTILVGFLNGLANGELVLGPAPKPDSVLPPGGPEAPAANGDGEGAPAEE